MRVRFITDCAERRRILGACHIDVTAGYMGVKRTLARISERCGMGLSRISMLKIW